MWRSLKPRDNYRSWQFAWTGLIVIILAAHSMSRAKAKSNVHTEDKQTPSEHET